MTAYDRYLAGYSSYPVRAVCTDCGHAWDGVYAEEYGTGWLEPHEDCPKCGSVAIDADQLTDLDVEERRLRGARRRLLMADLSSNPDPHFWCGYLAATISHALTAKHRDAADEHMRDSLGLFKRSPACTPKLRSKLKGAK